LKKFKKEEPYHKLLEVFGWRELQQLLQLVEKQNLLLAILHWPKLDESATQASHHTNHNIIKIEFHCSFEHISTIK
jgi:hypothetical protein